LDFRLYLLLTTTPQQSSKITEAPGSTRKEQKEYINKKKCHFNNITKDYKGNKYHIMATRK
jgi:hypothetical protein